jgi:hypothetical protein
MPFKLPKVELAMSFIVSLTSTVYNTEIGATVIVFETQVVVVQGLLTWVLKVVAVLTNTGLLANDAYKVIECVPAKVRRVATPIAN